MMDILVTRKNEENLKLTKQLSLNNNNNSHNNNNNNSNNLTNNDTNNNQLQKLQQQQQQDNNVMDYEMIASSNGDCIALQTKENVVNEVDVANEEFIDSQSSILQRFYDKKNVLVTGGTGFMGKMLIDKLLRTCPGIENIYMLVRPKKGKDIHTRLDDIFDDQVFSKLREEVPKFRHKIAPINGDCAMAGLGLSLNDHEKLVSNVNIVFHAAATVRFDEKLKLAVNINVHGTKELLDLCSQIQKLKAVIHVSTAYSNCHLRFIEEKLYKYPFHFNDLNRLIEKLDDKSLDEVTPTILGKWPNTYAFTKALAEDVIRLNGKNLPLGLFRPAIVTSSVKEPVVGWIDNLYGPTGVVAGVGTGVLRTLHCDRDIVANIVPVDMTVNALIATAWDVAENHEILTTEDIPIYNYVSSVEKPLTWGEFTDLNIKYGFKYPFSGAIWYLSFHTHKTAMMNKIYMIFLHILPAMLIDSLAMCVGQRPQLLKVYKKIHKFSYVISFFCTNEWMFTNNNVQRLWTRLTEQDQRLFDFNMKKMDWIEYSHHYIKGMRLYLFKDDLSTLEAAKRKWNRFYWLHQLLKAFLTFVILFLFWSTFSSYIYRCF